MKSQLSIQDSLSYSWDVFKKKPWFFIGLFLLTGLVGFIMPQISDWLLTNLRTVLEPNLDVMVFVPVWGGISILFQILSMVVTSWLAMGTTVITLRAIRGQDFSFAMLFEQKKRVLFYVLTTIVVGIVAAVGFILFIIPGIIWLLMNAVTMLLFVDKGTSTMDSIRQSIDLTKGYRMKLFLWGLVTIGLYILGAIPLGLGLLVVTPVISLTSAKIYDRLLAIKA